MATFTITTAVNIDSLASKAGSDTYNINGGYLTVDQDTRYGTNQNTSASMGNITLSATLGGTIEFTSVNVRLIPYNTGTGNVPALDTVISQGSASGKLIGVYSALNVAPTAAASAMPATGFIKIRQWNGTSYATGALTGIGASATGADTAGWLEIVGVDALTSTCNRLGNFKVRGDWFALGTTDGTRATTYQIPSNGAIVYLAGVWVETGTTTNVYEFYPCAGSLTALAANLATDAVRGKFCWISTAGLLRFGHDGTNSTGGYIPPSGRRIRIPNIFFMCCTAAALTANVLPNATLATRYDFTTTGAGVIDIQNAMLNWYPSFNQPFSVTLTNVGILTQLLVSEIASPIAWTQVGVGQEAANAQFGLSMALCFAGGTMTNCTWTSATLAASGRYVLSLTDISGFTVTNQDTLSLVARANATTGCATLTRVASSTWTNSTIGVGRYLLTTCTDLTFTNTIYYDHPATTTATANPMYLFDLATNCLRIKIDGITFGGLTMCQPYSGLLNIGAAGCTNIKLRNIGTYADQLELGDTRQNGVTWTRSAAVATVTKVAHGLKTNDIVFVIISSDIAAITVATKTVTGTPSADTFTFACINGGGSSGTLSYYPTMSAYVFALTAGAAANGVYIQRVYTDHTRTNTWTADNSSKNIVLESVFGDPVDAPVSPQLNGFHKGIGATHALTAQTSCYGTHWIDMYTNFVSANTVAQSWSRTTTTATVTSTDHGLRTGVFINVTVTSDAAAIVLGQKTVTVLTKDTFSFTCLNAGAASGTLTYVPLHGRIGLLMNESTADTNGQYSEDAGNPGFTSAGGLYMPSVNDQVTFICPHYVIGHTAFPLAEAVMAGGTIGNYDITYALDNNDGNGFSSFHNLAYTRAGGGGTSGQTNVTMTSTTGVEAGDYIWGTNIAPNAKVASITNGTTIVVDLANTGTVSGVLRFNHLPSETISDASKGFKLKIRLKTTTTNATAITSFYIYTLSTSTSRAYTYPLDLANITLSNVVSGSRYEIYNLTTSTTLATGTAASSTVSLSAFASDGDNLRIRIRNASSNPKYTPFETQSTVTSLTANVFVSQDLDTIAT